MSTIKIDSNAINNLITNPKQRKLVYSVYAVLGVVIGSIQVGFQTAGIKEVPWFEITTSVYIYLSVPFGVLAFVNSPDQKNIIEDDESVDVEAINDSVDFNVVEDSGYYLDEYGNKIYEINEYSDSNRKPKH